MTTVQLKGKCLLGPDQANTTDFSNFIPSAVITTSRSSITIPATLGTGRETSRVGTVTETVTLNFFSGIEAASMWATLYDAVHTDTAELYIELTLDEGAVGPDNPKWTGRIIINNVDTGADVGSLRQQSQTFAVTDAGLTKLVA